MTIIRRILLVEKKESMKRIGERMRTFHYLNIWQQLLQPDIVALLTKIHEYKGRQDSAVAAQGEILSQLLEIAMIQSTEASNRIEGIYTSGERLKKIVLDKTMLKNRNEQEIAGYRDVLATIHSHHKYMPVKPSVILQLHRDLYKYSGSSIGGSYKNSDNVIAQVDAQGNKTVRFQPTPAWETPETMEALCSAYAQALADPQTDALLLIPMFILDFLCIHPFNDGNGRLSRLLTLLLLYHADYEVGKYVSIEKIIENTKETYYDSLQASSRGWHENANDYAPFVRYLLGVVAAAYREFESRVSVLQGEGLSKADRIREIIKNTLGRITKAEIMERCPDISQVTVQRALNEMVKNKEVVKIGGGRYTTYVWNRENEV